MDRITNEDLTKITTCANQEVDDANFDELKEIYFKLEHLCELLKEKGFEYTIRKDPRKQAGPGTFKFQEYQWAQIFPIGYKEFCNKKVSYIIGLSDTLHFHIMGIKEYQETAPSLLASKESWTDIDIDEIGYEEIVAQFIKFENKHKLLFLKTANALGIKELAENYNKMKNKEIIDLLDYKNQIILQGPPGTGKTRLAKELAKSICIPLEISATEIIKILKVGTIVSSSTNYTNYEITAINESSITVKLENNSTYSPSLIRICEAYKSKLWLGGQVGGNHPYEAAIAKYIYENYPINDFSKIIQFHPSYSYEDFVRGISVQTKDGHPVYITEDRILMDFAKKASKNLEDSKKTIQLLSLENWVEKELKIFADSITEILADNQTYPLTNNVNIVDVDDSVFIYNGNTWQAINGHRMHFNDIILGYLLNANSRQEYKNINGISGRAVQHCSYDFKLLQKFREFLQTRPAYQETKIDVELKNYVLIIDEINRANLPSVLGELIYGLEYRNENVESLYSIENDRKLKLPKNLKIIGTMNTADRSVGHIDYAIRRRFAFVDVLPTPEPIREAGIHYFEKVCNLFIKNYNDVNWTNPTFVPSSQLAPDFKPNDVMLGHSYFITKEKDNDGKILDEDAQMQIKLKYEIIPILKEYIKDGILIDSNNDLLKNIC